MNYLVRGPRGDLQPRRPGQPHRQHARPVHRPRDQLPQPADAARGVPPPQPGGEGRLRRHAPGLRQARSPAGRRDAPGAADRHQRHQQGRRRVLPPRLQQRVRRPRLLAAPDQHLRPAPAASGTTARASSAGSSAWRSRAARSRSSATARSCATSSTSTTRSDAFLRGGRHRRRQRRGVQRRRRRADQPSRPGRRC